MAPAMQTVLRVIPMPADLGVGERIATGWLLAKLDQAGGVLPSGIFGQTAVLVGCGPLALQFPVHLGDCVSFDAVVLRSDASLAEVEVRVTAERRGASAPRDIMKARLRYVPVPQGEEDILFPGLDPSTFQP